VRSVRGARRVSHSTATRPSRAPGISHETWPPNDRVNRRSQPVGPHIDPPPAPRVNARPGTTLPRSFPLSRPIPLYPKIRLRMLLSVDPPT